MPKLRTLSGSEVLGILAEFGFQPLGQTQTLTIPNHKEIDRGTLHAIFRQACRFVAESELRPRLFAD